MIFAEVPADAVYLGGAIIVAALIAHTLWELYAHSRSVSREP